MVKKQLLAYLLLGIISLQLLPLREAGSIFYGNLMVEEIHQTADADGKQAEGNEDLKKNELYCSRTTLHIPSHEMSPLSIHFYDTSYASRLADDAPTRPPLAA